MKNSPRPEVLGKYGKIHHNREKGSLGKNSLCFAFFEKYKNPLGPSFRGNAP